MLLLVGCLTDAEAGIASWITRIRSSNLASKSSTESTRGFPITLSTKWFCYFKHGRSGRTSKDDRS